MEIILGKGNLTYNDIASRLSNKKQDADRFIITDISPITNCLGKIVSYLLGAICIGTSETKILRIIKSTYDKAPLVQGNVIASLNIWEARKGYNYLISYEKE